LRVRIVVVSRKNYYKNSPGYMAYGPLSGTQSFRLKFLWSCLQSIYFRTGVTVIMARFVQGMDWARQDATGKISRGVPRRPSGRKIGVGSWRTPFIWRD